METELQKLHIYGENETTGIPTSIWTALICFEEFDYALLGKGEVYQKYSKEHFFNNTKKYDKVKINLIPPIRKNQLHLFSFFSKKRNRFFLNVKQAIFSEGAYFVEINIFSDDLT